MRDLVESVVSATIRVEYAMLILLLLVCVGIIPLSRRLAMYQKDPFKLRGDFRLLPTIASDRRL